MAWFFRKKRIKKYTVAAKRYLSENFEEELVVKSVYEQLLDDIARVVSENDTNNNEDAFEEFESEATEVIEGEKEELEGIDKFADEPKLNKESPIKYSLSDPSIDVSGMPAEEDEEESVVIEESVDEDEVIEEHRIRYSYGDADIDFWGLPAEEDEEESVEIEESVDEDEVKEEHRIRYSYGDADIDFWGLPAEEDETTEERPIRHSYGDLDGEEVEETEDLEDEESSKSKIRFQQKKQDTGDRYNEDEISLLMQNLPNTGQTSVFLSALDRSIDLTFVDKLIYFINKKGMRDSQVYKAAQVDKRLFSKIMSDKNYKPSKDTVIALSFALGLTLNEATDLLSRAGYTLSHSNKRDVIIEYFFREGVHNIIDINEVLFNLNQKIIGRNN